MGPADLTYTADTTLYAQWTIQIYTVTFDPNNGTGGGTAKTGDKNMLSPNNIPADPVRDGYVFTGWYTGASVGAKVDLATHVFTADTTLYAQWTPPKITVQVMSTDGSQEADQQKIQELLNDSIHTEVTVELNPYTSAAGSRVDAFYIKGELTVPQGKTLNINCRLQVGSEAGASGMEADGRPPEEGILRINGVFTSTKEIVNHGTITNMGSMTVEPCFTNNGKFINEETVRFAEYISGVGHISTGPFTNNSGASVENHGIFTFDSIETVINIGTFDNTAILTCYSLENKGSFTNTGAGEINVKGTFTNEANGTFTNRGIFYTDAGAGISNSGTLYLNAGSRFNIDAGFGNEGAIIMTGESGSPSSFYLENTSSSGGINNQQGGRIEVGEFCEFNTANSVSPGVNNEGEIVISNGGTLSTNEYFTNTGTITNDGTYYGPALTGGTISGTNAGQVTSGNSQPSQP